ncbi:NAD(P)H-dependent oxidoreductase, partial [Bacillus cereus]
MKRGLFMTNTKQKIMEAFHFRHACKEFDPMK